ncbi:hypothetical protein [Sporisorium scitamineum]|uniref:Mig1 protein n=1 Tax=Sporisorium scitamineum TaxID=49012 RepID=A0A0F7RT12_9BASI|nr:hypothetical protein [Sporisorium scitamineum]
MKIQNSLATVAFALFLASTANANWLQPTPGNSWGDYCQKGGSKLDEPHACFRAAPAFINNISMEDSNFRGYLKDQSGKSDSAEFVVLYYGPQKSFLRTAGNVLEVTLSGRKCAYIYLTGRGWTWSDGKRLCKTETWDLPTKMWE